MVEEKAAWTSREAMLALGALLVLGSIALFISVFALDFSISATEDGGLITTITACCGVCFGSGLIVVALTWQGEFSFSRFIEGDPLFPRPPPQS
jgi:hypothetical protein